MDFSEWSTGKKVAAIVGLCCVGLIIITMIGGMASPDKTTTSKTDTTVSSNDTNTTNTTGGTEEKFDGWQVKIITEDKWTCAAGAEGSSSSYQGKGNKTIDIGEANIVSANAQKKSKNSKELKIQLLKDGEVRKESSTTAEYGIASVTDSG